VSQGRVFMARQSTLPLSPLRFASWSHDGSEPVWTNAGTGRVDGTVGGVGEPHRATSQFPESVRALVVSAKPAVRAYSVAEPHCSPARPRQTLWMFTNPRMPWGPSS
jgi:hypothetical protein